jgi:signal transduction histidine kinase
MRIRFVNRTMAELFHLPAIPKKASFLDEFKDVHVVEAVRSAITLRERTVRQIRFVPPGCDDATGTDGRHYLLEVAPLPLEAKRGAWLMVYDITDQVITDQIRKDFVVNASHELRTPLTIIQGYIETLQDGLIDDPKLAEKSLATMDKHCRRILRITEDMLTISRLEAEGTHLNLEPFSLRSCVQDAIEHLAPMLDGREVLFKMDMLDEGRLFIGDRFYWDQVFTNLLENAIKENDGRDLTIKICAQWVDDNWVIRVSDNGVGIAAPDLPFVFKRFYRGHKHHGRSVKGTGLGLSIVRRTVEAHGGSIDLRSVPGIETAFTIKVPGTGRQQTDDPAKERAHSDDM